MIREYVYLGNIPVGLFTKQKSNELLQIHTDHLGTPRAVTDKTKAVLWRWEGDAFGDVQPQIQTIKLPLRHAGQYFDSESGLFYNWHRFYIPELGRYNRVDDLGLFDGTNPYNYVHGNPTAKVDPDGQLAMALPAIAVGAVAVAVCYGVGACQNLSKSLSDAVDGLNITLMPSHGNVADTQVVGAYNEAASENRQCGNEPPDRCQWLNKDIKMPRFVIKSKHKGVKPISINTKPFVFETVQALNGLKR